MDPLRVVARIPPKMQVERLRERLVRIITDFRAQVGPATVEGGREHGVMAQWYVPGIVLHARGIVGARGASGDVVWGVGAKGGGCRAHLRWCGSVIIDLRGGWQLRAEGRVSRVGGEGVGGWLGCRGSASSASSPAGVGKRLRSSFVLLWVD